MQIRITFYLLILAKSLLAQNPNPPCGDDYGSASDETTIIEKMRFGSIAEANDAIAQGKNTRGFALGCPQAAVNYSVADPTPPLLADVESIWLTNHLPTIEAFSINCPRIGRYENNAALGAYYAILAGYPADYTVLGEVGDMQEAQQYSSSNVNGALTENEGVYGYIHVGNLNPCYPGGVVGSSVDAICTNIPSLCVDYDNGLFAGENFLIGDQYEPLDFYDGGIAYDHAWIGVQLIEAAIQQSDNVLKGKFKNSVELAADWAINEHPVKNHNYTAKLIWLLAEMYLWTGDTIYMDALNYKLDKNLIPSVLMDLNPIDGNVDGTTPAIAFSDLTVVAQEPGRCWDGHNSLPWYNAMNAWAMTEAYVAFRDRGETVRANELKPYVIAMLDNLAWEVNNLGVIDDQLGVRDLTYSFLIGIWKVAQYENEAHPEWEAAAWAMWNTGYFDNYSTHTVCVGLYLCVLSNTSYQPLFDREQFDSIQSIEPTNKLSIYPNPANEQVNLVFDNFYHDNYEVMVFDLRGQLIFSRLTNENHLSLDVEDWQAGCYYLKLQSDQDHSTLTEKLIVY